MKKEDTYPWIYFFVSFSVMSYFDCFFSSVCLAEAIHNMAMDTNSMTLPLSDPNAWATAMNNLGMPPIGMTGQPLMPGRVLQGFHQKTKHNFKRGYSSELRVFFVLHQ